MKNLLSLRFRILAGRDKALGRWWNLEFSWNHHFVMGSHSSGEKWHRHNWDEFSIGIHSWWVRPGYHCEFYDGPHPVFSLGFIVLAWESCGSGEYIDWDYVDGKPAKKQD